MIDADARAVLDFWFAPEGDPAHGTPRPMWFQKRDETDREIAGRFGSLIERALRGELDDWAAEPDGALALLLLLDQFPRNAFRGTARAFEGDAAALRIARAMIAARHDAALRPEQRAFVYLPFEHAEDRAMQDEAVRLFTRLAADAPAMEASRVYAEKHREIVRRFGRFPHRNETLGRPSTADELAFLREPGSRF